MPGIDAALEARVLECLDASDAAAAATLTIRGYGPQILGYLTAVLRDEPRAADAFALFGESVWKGLPSFRRASSVRTWAYKLAAHAAADVARSSGRRRAMPLATSAAVELAAQVRSATALHLRTETKTAVQKLREELTGEEQALLILRVDRALEWAEVSEVLGAPAAILRKRFERLKDKLRALARERGLREG